MELKPFWSRFTTFFHNFKKHALNFEFLYKINVENISWRTGKSLSEALIFAPTNPQYDDRLLIELRVQFCNVVYTNCFFLFLFWHSKQFMYTKCSELGIFTYWIRNSMNNLLSYYGLVNGRISASEKYFTMKQNC